MIIKKYIVNDMKEAIIRAKYELGKEAVIISERNIKIGKWYNPFKISKLEVIVAVEEGKPMPSPKVSIKEAIETDPIFRNASSSVKRQLEEYCYENSIEGTYLSLEEKKSFLRNILTNNCFDDKMELGKINVMVGPTGVGKTTTIAKLAAKEYLLNKKKVGLITIDTYRIGAVEQLKTYANILDIPFEVVNEPIEMKSKIEKLDYCDIILIDTLGTSPRDQGKIDDISKYLRALETRVNIYLVLSISTDSATLSSIMDRYKRLNYEALILTKFDELSNLKNLWYIMEGTSLPVQFFCCGQDVPDDIQVATLDNLFNYCEENYWYD